MKELGKFVQARLRLSGRKTTIALGVLVVGLLIGAGGVFAGAAPGREAAAVGKFSAPGPASPSAKPIVGHSVRNDTSPALRDMTGLKPWSVPRDHEVNLNPSIYHGSTFKPDAALQTKRFRNNMPSPTLNFDGIRFPGVNCSCAPPDTNGEVGDTQYVQIVNTGFQVFDKTDGGLCLRSRVDRLRSGPGSAASARQAARATRSCSTTRSPTAG